MDEHWQFIYLTCFSSNIFKILAGHYTLYSICQSGILLYEMLYGRTPFRGKNRQKTFSNILRKDLTFPSSIQVESSYLADNEQGTGIKSSASVVIQSFVYFS